MISAEDLPGFARSTMDGYAVRSADTYGAKETLPAYITVYHEVLMGEKIEFEIKAGEAAKIPTGGMLPVGADAVVMLEHTQVVSETMIEIMKSVAIGENVIQRDEDIKKGIFGYSQRTKAQGTGHRCPCRHRDYFHRSIQEASYRSYLNRRRNRFIQRPC